MFLAPNAVTEPAIVKYEPGERMGPIIRSSYPPVAENEDLQIGRLVGSIIHLDMFFSTDVQVIGPGVDIQAHHLVTPRHLYLREYIL